MKSHLQLQRTALLALLIGSSDSMAVRNVPHGHQGKLRPITPGPFAIKLTASQEATLKAGDPVIIKQSTPESSSGGSICIQDVEAPVSAVWHQILDLDNYNTKAPKVVQSNNYVVQQHADGRATLKTKLVFRIFPGLSFDSYYDHTFHPKHNSLTWSLDYDRKSDIDDVAGHWHVTQHPERPNCSRVFYAYDVKMMVQLPRSLFDTIVKDTVEKATAWVKRESEAHPKMTWHHEAIVGSKLSRSPL